MRFRDRHQAGRLLGRELAGLGLPDPVVFALPRGGVPVGAEVARVLGAPLEVLVARKLGAPDQPEYGIGALAEGGVTVLDEAAVVALGLTRADLGPIVARENAELDRRVRLYRGGREPLAARGRTAIVIDDGLATGVTALAALAALRRRGAARLVFAAPVCAPDAELRLGGEADRVVCLTMPQDFGAVGRWYDDFDQVPDDVVVALLGGADQPVTVAAGAVALPGDLAVPPGARGVVLFAHGSGSSRHSPRNRAVAEHLRAAGLATLLLDLLTEQEERARDLRFDIALLADRLTAAADWLGARPGLARLPLGLFGASSGAAAALVTAARRPDRVSAVVSRGGRPDLAGEDLGRVRAPVLLLVGSRDPQVLDLNRAALTLLPAAARLEVVPGATHLFPEPGALEEVARLAAGWFLGPPTPTR